MEQSDRDTIRQIISRNGKKFVEKIVTEESSSDVETLTIICNEGLHPIPKEFIEGEMYVASQGNLDFSSVEAVNDEIDAILFGLKIKLHERPWKKVILIPFGHSVICMNIKMAVYRVLRLETVDLFFFGNGKYGAIERETRSVLIKNSA